MLSRLPADFGRGGGWGASFLDVRGESTRVSLEDGVIGRSRTLAGVVARIFATPLFSLDTSSPPDDFVLVTLCGLCTLIVLGIVPDLTGGVFLPLPVDGLSTIDLGFLSPMLSRKLGFIG